MPMTFPVKDFQWRKNIAQLMGVNAALYKLRFGMVGHNGLDITSPPDTWGKEVVAAHDGRVTQWNNESPASTKGNGLWIQGYHEGKLYQSVYWHLSGFNVMPGEDVKAGQVIGYIGNTGQVYPVPSPSCPHCGSHLHFGIKELRIVPPGGWNTQIIPTLYDGYIDPTPLLYRVGDKLPIRFDRNLFIGQTHDQIAWLQTCLKLEGLAHDYEPTGYYGTKTARDVGILQGRYGLGSFGYTCGPKTRSLLTEKYALKTWSL